jgi:hypothetical protein
MVTTICRRTTTDGILLSKAEKDIWMRDKGDHYEYVAVYVDDLLIASREPQTIITALETTQVQVEGIWTYRIPFGMRLRS